jgi:hypothetical protein
LPLVEQAVSPVRDKLQLLPDRDEAEFRFIAVPLDDRDLQRWKLAPFNGRGEEMSPDAEVV